jgi:hypothetical protein
MTEIVNVESPLQRTIALAAKMASKHQPILSLAYREHPGSWQEHEYKQFFLSGIYQELTGRQQVSSIQELIDPAVTAEGAQWMGSHCLNP